MSRNQPDHYRPSYPSPKNHRHANQSTNRSTLPPNNRQQPSKPTTPRAHQPSYPFSEAQDDLIAPTASSTSIPSLERWARATALFPQRGLGRREDVVVERIERRYGGGAEVDERRYEGTTKKAASEAGGDEGFARDAMHQRKREREAAGDGGGVKRRRGEEVVDLTGDEGAVIDLTGADGGDTHEGVDYAQSSEWSWPGSPEDA